jgi:hypothetical protein
MLPASPSRQSPVLLGIDSAALISHVIAQRDLGHHKEVEAGRWHLGRGHWLTCGRAHGWVCLDYIHDPVFRN